MKFRLDIKEFDKDTIVTFLSDCFYQSQIFAVDVSKCNTANQCYEEELADMLLNGETITVLDIEGDKVYNKKLHNSKWSGDNNYIAYDISLKDIKRGFEKAFKKSEYGAKSVLDLFYHTGYNDMFNVCYLMQFVVFGEEIYG